MGVGGQRCYEQTDRIPISYPKRLITSKIATFHQRINLHSSINTVNRIVYTDKHVCTTNRRRHLMRGFVQCILRKRRLQNIQTRQFFLVQRQTKDQAVPVHQEKLLLHFNRATGAQHGKISPETVFRQSRHSRCCKLKQNCPTVALYV